MTPITSQKFIDIWNLFGLHNHIEFSTHESSHMLDLIIKFKFVGLNITFTEPSTYISDHYFVRSFVDTQKPKAQVKEILKI